MTSSQDTLGRLDEAKRGVRAALQALGQIPSEDVPRVTNDGIQHELREVEERLQVVRDDVVAVEKQTGQDRE